VSLVLLLLPLLLLHHLSLLLVLHVPSRPMLSCAPL
jgi:hypothetical protein